MRSLLGITGSLRAHVTAALTRLQEGAYGFRQMKNPALLLLAPLAAFDATVVAQPTQPIYAQYDGFVRNKNGTLTLSFGYFNQNNAEVSIAAGDANTFAPAPGDRNQPIAF